MLNTGSWSFINWIWFVTNHLESWISSPEEVFAWKKRTSITGEVFSEKFYTEMFCTENEEPLFKSIPLARSRPNNAASIWSISSSPGPGCPDYGSLRTLPERTSWNFSPVLHRRPERLQNSFCLDSQTFSLRERSQLKREKLFSFKKLAAFLNPRHLKRLQFMQ